MMGINQYFFRLTRKLQNSLMKSIMAVLFNIVYLNPVDYMFFPVR